MVTLNMPPELESRLRDEAAREGVDPDTFIVRAIEMALRVNRRTDRPAQLTSRESELLGNIGLGLSDADWEMFRELRSKSEADALSEKDRAELLAITERIERANAARMKNLVELAALREVSLDKLMDELGLGNGMEIGGGPKLG
jgi:hypothetical protein